MATLAIPSAVRCRTGPICARSGVAVQGRQTVLKKHDRHEKGEEATGSLPPGECPSHWNRVGWSRRSRRSDLKIILAAADALGAMGAKRALAEIGLAISLITGPCTDKPILLEWTERLCGIPAMNL